MAGGKKDKEGCFQDEFFLKYQDSLSHFVNTMGKPQWISSFFSCQSTAAVVALYLYANNIRPLHRDKMDRSLSILPCRLAALYSALLRDNGRVDTDVSESFISQCECHYALLVLMFILRIPHPCKCQFMQSAAFVCTAFGGPLGLTACICVHVTPQNVAQLLVALAEWRDLSWQGTLFVLKHSLLLSNGSGIMIFSFLACRNFETVEMADNQGQCIWTCKLQWNYSAICCQNMRDYLSNCWTGWWILLTQQ